MNILFYILFFLFSLGQIGRISLQNQIVNVYLYEIVLLGTVIWLGVRYKHTPLKNSFKKFKSLFVFFTILALSLFLSSFSYNLNEDLIACLYLFRLLIYFSFFIYLTHHLKKTKNLKILLNKSVLLFFGITAVVSVAQYLLYPNLRNLSYLGWDPHQYRVFGLFFDTGVTASVYGLALLYLFLRSKSLNLGKVIVSVFFVTFSVLGLLTFSRGFYLALLTTVIYYLISKKKYGFIFIFISLFVVAILLLPKPFGEGVNIGRTFSIVSRLNDYKEGLQIAAKSPIIGVGYNRIREFKEPESSTPSHSGASFHSSFLIILVTSGIAGLILFLLTLLDLSRISSVSQYYLIFLSIFSLFDNIILHPFILFLLLTLLSMELSATRDSRSS